MRKRDQKEYNIWKSAKARCHTPTSKDYGRYGSRGISMCKEWRDSYEVFLRDIGPKPEGYTLDRIDNNGNYEPGNVKWASRKEQSHNRNNNNNIEYNGETHNLTEWARIIGIHRNTLEKRFKLGWSIEDTLSRRPRKK
jgi:hypothetical protein